MQLEIMDSPRPDDSDIMTQCARECPACESKPGTPALCPACLHNRDLVYALQKRISKMQNWIEAVQAVWELQP